MNKGILKKIGVLKSDDCYVCECTGDKVCIRMKYQWIEKIWHGVETDGELYKKCDIACQKLKDNWKWNQESIPE